MSDVKCAWMNRRGYDDYICNKVGHRVPYDIFIRYCTSYSYDECKNYTACYIATVVCNELGPEKTKKTLTILKHLRYYIMEKDPQYEETLNNYDIVGQRIAENIELDEFKPQIVKNLYNLCIEEVGKLVESNKVKEAINLYNNMVGLLDDGYKQNRNRLIKRLV